MPISASAGPAAETTTDPSADGAGPIDIDAILKALSHPVRRQILAWLAEPWAAFPEQTCSLELGVCAGQIDARTGLSQSTVSAHLATLTRASLITSTRVGQWHFFQRNEAVIDAFRQWVSGGL